MPRLSSAWGCGLWLCFTLLQLTTASRTLLQEGAFGFWSGERRVTNNTIPYTTRVQPHTSPTVNGGEFGGCKGPFCPSSLLYVVKRICFASQAATVTISTYPGRRSEYFDTELYFFRVADDVPPIRDDPGVAQYKPTFETFWAAPDVITQYYDNDSGSICSTAADPATNVCGPGPAPATGPCSRTPAGGIVCPAGSQARGLSQIRFQLLHEWNRPEQCYYAAIAALDAPRNVTELSIGLEINLGTPEPSAPGSSPDNPRNGPFDLRDLGIGALPEGVSAVPLVEPAWLNLTQAVASGCVTDSCVSDPDFEAESRAPMFVYQNLCFRQSLEFAQTAQIRTSYGGSGPSDTTLFVYNEARTVSEWNDAGFLTCSDGSVPDKANCGPDKVCQSAADQCPGDAVLWQLSRVDLPIGVGPGQICFNAAVGITLGAGSVINVGVDALLLGPDGKPTQTVEITTDTFANGTTVVTTATTFANGTMTTDTNVIVPNSTMPLAPAPLVVPDEPEAPEPAPPPVETPPGLLGAVASGNPNGLRRRLHRFVGDLRGQQ